MVSTHLRLDYLGKKPHAYITETLVNVGSNPYRLLSLCNNLLYGQTNNVVETED